MSIGNLKDNGNKGNNFPYQLNTLKTLGLIAGSVAGAATEATLLQVLASIQAGQEYEQNLVLDLGGVGCPTNCPTYLQIRIWNSVTHTFDPPIYYDADGNLVVPIGPLELVNPQFVLENILLEVTAINATLDVPLSTVATEITLAAAAADLATILTNTNNLDVALSTLNAEATQLLIKALLTTIDTATTGINTKLASTPRTPTMLRSSGISTIPAGTRSASIYNAGLANGTVLGAVLKPGERVTFEAGAQLDTLTAAISYDGTGTDLLIIYIS